MKNLLTSSQFSGNSFNSVPVKSASYSWRLLLSCCIALLSVSGAFAQIVTDGDPSDWAGFTTTYPAHALVNDVANASGNTDDQFTQGSKDQDLVQAWRWTPGSSNAKGDIDNAGAALDGCTLHFFVDRFAINGDAAIGFWFLKDAVAKDVNKKFSGAHSDGDVLVLSHFTNGGGTSDIYKYQWNGSTPGSLVFIGTSTTAQVNTQPYSVPADWTYTPKVGSTGTYPTGSFYEGEIDLCALFNGQAPCFASFMAETRNSQSITASLQDFALGSFTTDVSAPIVAIETEPSICGPSTGCVTVDAGAERAGTYTLEQVNVANSTQTFTYPADGNTVRFCGLLAGEGYSVTFETSSGCASEATVCPSTTRHSKPSSTIKPVKVGNADAKIKDKDLVAYPVPFSDKVTVKFTAERAESYVINLYNMQGKLIKELKSGDAKAGDVIQMEVNGKNLIESMYLVKKESKSGVSTLKLLKSDH